MMATLDAKDLLHAGEPLRALRLLQEQVRAKPGDVRLRVFLFQLLCVLGQWERALNQLDTAANLDPSVLAMKHMYGSAIACELLRAQVFKGEKAPLVLGQPEAWLALLIEALLRGGELLLQVGGGDYRVAVQQVQGGAGIGHTLAQGEDALLHIGHIDFRK